MWPSNESGKEGGDHDARVVFGLWRRILRNPNLSRRLFEIDPAALAEAFSLSDEETAIAAEYAAHPKAAQMFITGYRYRVIGSFANALETGAPLSYRALRACGADMRALGEAFLDAHGWHDYGPWVMTHCDHALAFLMRHAITETPDGFRDLLRVDRAAVALLMQWADADPEDDRVLPPSGHGGRWALTERSVVVRAGHDLSPWLRDTSALGRSDLPRRDTLYLVVLSDLKGHPRFSAINRRVAAVIDALTEGPATVEELGSRLAARDVSADAGEVTALLGQLSSRGAVRGLPGHMAVP